jgi:hypothetical protein
LVFAAAYKKADMKKNISSNAQDGGHTEGQGRNVAAKKRKTNNSQAMGDMLSESDEQKAGRDKNKQGQNTGRNDSRRK